MTPGVAKSLTHSGAAALGGKLKDAEKDLAALQAKLAMVPDNIYLKDSTYQAFLLVQQLRAAKEAQDKLANSSQTSQSESRIKASNAFADQVAKDKAAVSDLLTELSGIPKKYIDTMRKIGELHASGALTGEAYTKALDGAHGMLKKPTAPKKTGGSTPMHKFNQDDYLAILKKKTVEGWEAITAAETEALRKNDALLAKNDIDRQAHAEAQKDIAKGAALDRQELMAKETETSLAEMTKRYEAEKQLKAQQKSGLDAAKGIIAGMNPIDAIRFEEDQRIAVMEEYRQIDLENEQVYVDAKNAIHQAAAERLADMQNANNAASLSMASGLAGDIYQLLQQSGQDQTALGKALFLTNKAIAVAEIIMNTEVAAKKAEAQTGIFGIPMSTMIRATGYASAGMVAGLAIGQVAGGRQYGGPANSGNLYRVNEKGAPEMFTANNGSQYMMPTQSGRVTAADKVGGGNITIINNGRNPIGQVTRETKPNGDQAIYIHDIAIAAVNVALGDPNSSTSRSFSRNFNTQRSR